MLHDARLRPLFSQGGAATTRHRRALAASILVALGLAACGPRTVAGPSASPPEPTWEATLDRVVPCVVSLHVDVPRGFDMMQATRLDGTGFVVDRERGLVLTNRHLVMTGPVSAEAVFQSREVIPLVPVYRDPVHDFGFYRFDPAAVQHTALCELPLAPEFARVGVDIRVVGNDATEQISILAGTLARLDREAPAYGRGRYEDFNTFYLQAASGTSGGSSGSPVVDIEGRVLALNAGGHRKAAASYYLPLDRVVRALDLIRAGRTPPRGTIQTIFRFAPFDELERLGLPRQTEDWARRQWPDGSGLLVVEQVLPEGPADGLLQPGDVLLSVAEQPVNAFVGLEAALDDSVGGVLSLQVARGDQTLRREPHVQSAHDLVPDRYIELGGTVMHPVSYQIARSYHLPVRGVYVAQQGYMLEMAELPSGSLLTELDGTPVQSLDDAWALLRERHDRDPVRVRYVAVSDPRAPRVRALRVDRRWFPMRECARTDATWTCSEAPPAPPDPLPGPIGTTPVARQGRGPAAAVGASIVMVEFSAPYAVEGLWDQSFRGAGLVVDAERGLVLTDRDTAPVTAGDATITFGATLTVPAEVVAVHPTYDLAIVRYDPTRVPKEAAITAVISPETIAEGDDVWQVVLDSQQRLVTHATRVDRIRPLALTFPHHVAQFRAINLDGVRLVDATSSVGGVLTDGKGRVQALWASFHEWGSKEPRSFMRGVPIALAEPLIEAVREGRTTLPVLGVELDALPLSEARDLGLSDAWVQRLAETDPDRREAIQVRRVFRGAPIAGTVHGGDLLLAVGGHPVSRFADVEKAALADQVDLTVLSEGKLLELRVDTLQLPIGGLERFAFSAGLVLHDPHLEVSAQHGLEPVGVYVSSVWHGSPGSRYQISPTVRIVQVDGQPTPTLDALLQALAGRRDGEHLRLQLIGLDDKPSAATLVLDQTQWPTLEFVRTSRGWERMEASGSAPAPPQ